MSSLHPSRRSRQGFTAIELLMVIGIMMILMAAAVPSIIPALRKGALNNVAGDITACWRQARALAMNSTVPTGLKPPFYGIVIFQQAGQRPYVALIYDNAGLGTMPNLLMQGQLAGAPYDPSGTPVAQFFFNRNVIIASGATNPPTTADVTLVVYAQYETGLPVSPADVHTSQGMMAQYTSFGVSTGAAVANSLCPYFDVQTLDYVPGTRGYALGLALYQAGCTSALAIQE